MISQSGNAHEDGFVPEFWAPLWAYAEDPGPKTEAAVRTALDLDAIRWQYLHGVDHPERVDPDTWTADHRDVSRPGNDLVQLALFRDYATNRPLYPRLHAYFRDSRVPLLGSRGPHLRPERRARLRAGPAGRRDPPGARRRPLPAGEPPADRRRPHPGLPGPGAADGRELTPRRAPV